MVVLRVQYVHLDDLDHAAGVDGDEVVRMGRIVRMSHKLVSLVGTRHAILPVVLATLPPVAGGGEQNPAQYHDKDEQAHEDHPAEQAAGRMCLSVDDNLAPALLNDLIAMRVNVPPGAAGLPS